MEAANSLRFRNALVFLRHQLRSTYAVRPRQQCRTNINTSDPPIRKNFAKECMAKFINQGLGDMKSISTPTSGLLDKLEERGFLGQFHGDTEQFKKLTDNEVIHIYAGADATAPSLHLGHLMVLMPMFLSMLHGHRVTFIVGIATARIGDPSGRHTERDGMRDRSLGERTFSNGTMITTQLSTLLKNVINHAKDRGYDERNIGRRHVNSNLQWHRNVSIIDFMQIVGHRSRIGEMMLRKSVSERLKSEDGLSFSEFSYQLIQAMDYWHLFSALGVRLQIGGSDQWGNITAGCDLINRMVNEAEWIQEQPTPALIKTMAKPYGLTVPLLTNASGEKISKSTGGDNIWLSSRKTPPFTLYQYLLNRPDDVMEQYLKFFTILPIPEINKIMELQRENPGLRPAQKKLAYEVVSLLHGKSDANKCLETTAIFFGQSDDSTRLMAGKKKLETGLQRQDVEGISSREFWEPVAEEDVIDMPLEKVLVAGGVAPSNSQARTLLKSGGLSMGPHLRQIRMKDGEKLTLTREDIIGPDVVLFKVGKNKLHVIRLVPQEKLEEVREKMADPYAVDEDSRPLSERTKRQKKSAKKAAKKAATTARRLRRGEENKLSKKLRFEQDKAASLAQSGGFSIRHVATGGEAGRE